MTATAPRRLATAAPTSFPHAAIVVRTIVLHRPRRDVEELRDLLSPDERARAARFRSALDRSRYIVAHGELRRILAAEVGADAAALRFTAGPRGKPSLAAPAGGRAPHFNLSHADGLALVAISPDCEVGVDVERVHPIPEACSIAAYYFSPSERAALERVPPALRDLAFLQCWTRKEAMVKALGDGLAFALDRFDVTLAPGEEARLLRVDGDVGAAARWTLRAVHPASGYVAAVAAPHPDLRAVVDRWR